MLCEKKMCTGCGSCLSVCPLNCIRMKSDKEGFKYPEIDMDVCVSCRMCERTCPVLNKDELCDENEAFAAINHNDSVRSASSSGGVFHAMALAVLRQGGYVCGAIYDEDFQVKHVVSDKKQMIDKMLGAKYTQSNPWECFKKIKQKLEDNKKVLFVGTPCQVAGIRKYLQKEYDHLLLVDFICHGVPSPMIWKHYVEERQKLDSDGSELLNVELRNKESGWSRYRYAVKFSYKNHTPYFNEQSNDTYMRGFVNNLFLRPSCSTCCFKGINRYSDITLGDYWGIWKQYPEFDDNKGASVIIIHTDKGKNMWGRVSDEFTKFPVDIKKALEENPSAFYSSKPHKNRDAFFKHYKCNKSVIRQIEKKLVQKNRKQRIVQIIRKKVFNGENDE